jgi:tetratricopeptide (TPR) repeat protein
MLPAGPASRRENGGRSEQAYALLILGDALLGLGSLDEANAAFQRSLAIRQELGQATWLLDSLAGAARAAMAAGDLAQAQYYVHQIVDSSGTLIDNADDPYLVYLTCIRLLRHYQDARAGAMAAQAHRLLMEQAGRIEDAARRRAFLEQDPSRRELVAAYQELS